MGRANHRNHVQEFNLSRVCVCVHTDTNTHTNTQNHSEKKVNAPLHKKIPMEIFDKEASVDQEMEDVKIDAIDANVATTSINGYTSDSRGGLDTDYDNSYDNFYRAEGFGVWGMIERLDVNLKLTVMMVVVLCGFFAVATFLFVVQGVTIKRTRQSRIFQSVSVRLNEVIQNIQYERERSNIYYAQMDSGVSNETIANLKDQIAKTDAAINNFYRYTASYNLKSDPTIKSGLVSFDEGIRQVRQARNNTLENKFNAISGFVAYNGVITRTLDVLGKFSLLKQDNAALSSYAAFSNLIELEYQLKTTANIAFTFVRNGFSTVRGFVKFSGQRDYALTYWRSITYPNIVQYYDSAINASVVAELKSMFETAVDPTKIVEVHRVNNDTILAFLYPPTLYSLERWNELSQEKINVMYTVNEKLRDYMRERSQASLVSSIGIIVGVMCVVFVFSMLQLVTAIVVIWSISGPWRRKNMIQENFVKKYISERMLRMLNCDRIDEATLGRHVNKRITVASFGIENMAEIMRDLKSNEVVDKMNNYMSKCIPSVNNSGGYIDKITHCGFSAVFSNKRNAIIASKKIKHEMANIETSVSERAIFGVGLHTSDMVLGTVGNDQRMDGVVLGRNGSIAVLAQRVMSKLRTGILCTKDTVEGINVTTRLVGYLRNANGVLTEMHEIVSTKSNKMKTKRVFEEAIDLFAKGRYVESRHLFDQITNSNPKDALPLAYSKKIGELITGRSIRLHKMSMDDIMNNPLLESAFLSFVSERISVYLIELWKLAHPIECDHRVGDGDALVRAKKMWDEYLMSGSSRHVIIGKNICSKIENAVALAVVDTKTVIEVERDLDHAFVDLRREISAKTDRLVERFKESAPFESVVFASGFIRDDVSMENLIPLE